MCELLSLGAFLLICCGFFLFGWVGFFWCLFVCFHIKNQRKSKYTVHDVLLKINSGDVEERREGKGWQRGAMAHSISSLFLKKIIAWISCRESSGGKRRFKK